MMVQPTKPALHPISYVLLGGFLLFLCIGVFNQFLKPDQDVTSDLERYSGYLGVGTAGEHQLHYWLAQSQNDPTKDPLIVWLSGGPGCSSLYKMFSGTGPYIVRMNSSRGVYLEGNSYSLNRNASVLYISAPANFAGFSYSTIVDDNSTSDNKTTSENWQALVQFYTKHPTFRAVDLYLSGDSYGGTFVTLFASKILEKMPEYYINLKGVAIGNGMVDAALERATVIPYLYQHGLIAIPDYQRYLNECCGGQAEGCPTRDTSLRCQKLTDDLKIGSTYGSGIDPYGLHHECKPDWSGDIPTDCDNTWAIAKYLNDPARRRNLGIPPFVQDWKVCRNAQQLNYTKQYPTVLPQVKRALGAGIKVMLYYGDMDAICNPILGLRFTLQIFEAMQWTIPDYQPYHLANRVAGKWLQIAGCSFATVRNAGHNVGRDRPEVLQHLFEKFIAGKAPATRGHAHMRQLYLEALIPQYQGVPVANDEQIVVFQFLRLHRFYQVAPMRINHLFENFSDVSDPAEGVRIGAAPPTWLSGNFLRNGPGKFKFGDDEVNHWFDGMAYPQRYHFENGRMLYSAKFLKSHAYLACEKDKRLAVSTFATPRSVQKNMKAKPDSGAYNCLVNFLQEDISNHVAEILSCSAHPIRDRDVTVTEPTCFRDALFWKERQYVNIILVDKKTGNRHPRKFFAPPFFTFHHANAFERDGFLYVDFCLVANPGNFEDLLLQHMRDGSFSSRNPLFRPFLHRIVIPTNVSGGIEAGIDLAEHSFELPRYNEHFTGVPYRFVYGTTILYAGQKRIILVPVMSANLRKKPIFMILDAKSLREICRYVLPVPRIPMGFHAIFVDAAAGDKEN
ncbi:unnamed protein product, partial [Mesorhabditis spiculigera]